VRFLIAHDASSEAFSQGLGKVFGGGADLILSAQRMGVPEALGMTTREWVEAHLGGYVRLSLEERRETVKSLTMPVEDGGKGLSTRQAAEILGISHETVRADAKGVKNLTPIGNGVFGREDQGVKNLTPPAPALTRTDLMSVLETTHGHGSTSPWSASSSPTAWRRRRR
jgi:hypothetical protein